MERHWDAASQGEKPAPAGHGIAVSRQSFCDYIVSARKQRGLSINEIATVTRIPVRSLERLESGLFEELPADVFVRGFLRSYARCVGLDAEETIRRYTACGMPPAPVSLPAAAAIDESGPVPASATAAEQPADGEGRAGSAPVRRSRPVGDARLETDARAGQATETAAHHERAATESRPAPAAVQATRGGDDDAGDVQSRRKRKRRRKKQRRGTVEASSASVTAPVSPAMTTPGMAIGAAPEPRRAAAEAVAPASTAERSAPAPSSSGTGSGIGSDVDAGRAEPAADPVAPGAVTVALEARHSLSTRVPARSQSAQHSVARARASTVTARPVLVIDDEHPEEAERSQEERVERNDSSWRSFLPPSLLDSDDGSHRSTLTLAVIILVIVATLTMSYLLRRPNVSGDGVTWRGSFPGELSGSRAHA